MRKRRFRTGRHRLAVHNRRFELCPIDGTIRGSVADPSGAVIAGATVEIQNPVSHYNQQTKTDSQGNFVFNNVPFNNYHVTASASGFSSSAQDTDVRSSVAVQMPKFTLQVGAAASSVTVEAAADLVETESDHPHGCGSGVVRQAASGKPILVAQFPGHAGIARRRRRLERSFSWTRRSRVKLFLGRRPADYRPAKQGLLESDSS